MEPMDVHGLRALKKKMKEDNEQKYMDESNKRLCKIVEPKITTPFIGALSQFEQEFGFLWGHTDNAELTEEQEFLKDIWEKTRTAVLNNGNNQIRAARTEIANHNVKWNRYHMELPVKPIKQDDKEENSDA